MESPALGTRLRSLRDAQFPGSRVTQKSLADAFGVAMSSVSSWESGKVPPPSRLRAYASFFATRRSLDGATARVLTDDELTPDELAIRDELLAEFESLHAADRPRAPAPRADGERLSGLWRFDGKGRTRIFCGALHPDERLPYAKAAAHNYMQLSAYTDLDALVELFGHLRAANPAADVRFDLAPRLESDDVKDHLVVLGSGVMNPVARGVAELAGLPLRQVPDDEKYDEADPQAAALPGRLRPTVGGEVFQLAAEPSRVFRPHVVAEGAGDDRVVWDVGFFHRSRSPFNVDCTLTFCSGVFTRGVYGAVRMFTDKKLRDHNEAYVAQRYGSAESLGLLVRVPVIGHATSTPDLRDPRTIIRAWADGEPVE